MMDQPVARRQRHFLGPDAKAGIQKHGGGIHAPLLLTGRFLYDQDICPDLLKDRAVIVVDAGR